MNPERQDAANDVMSDIARKWLSFQQLPRDRDVAHGARGTIRVTAFVQIDDHWHRCELVVARHNAEYVVLQPYPQGRPLIFEPPFRVVDEGLTTKRDAHATVHDVELVTADRSLSMRLEAADLDLLKEALVSK